MSVSGISSWSGAGLLNLPQRRNAVHQTSSAGPSEDVSAALAFRDVSGPEQATGETVQQAMQVKTDLVGLLGTLSAYSAPAQHSVASPPPKATASNAPTELFALFRAAQTSNPSEAAAPPSLDSSSLPSDGGNDLDALLRAVQSGLPAP